MGFGHWIKKHVTHKIIPKGRFRKAVDKVTEAYTNPYRTFKDRVLNKSGRDSLRNLLPSTMTKVNKALTKVGEKMAASVSNSASTQRSTSAAASKPYQLASRNTGYTLDTSYRSLNSLTRR